MSYLDSEYPGPLPENIAIATASLTSDEIDPRRGDSPPSRFYQDDEQDIGKHEEDEDNQEDVYDEVQFSLWNRNRMTRDQPLELSLQCLKRTPKKNRKSF